MGLNDQPSAERLHIGFFGLRNAGKSSLVNAVTGQKLSVVSAVKGTTTDPVQKAMELLPLGPVVIIDTPGIDDEGELGEMRVQRARQALTRTDLAVLVTDAQKGLQPAERELCALFASRGIPHLIAYNKCDLASVLPVCGEQELCVSAATGTGVQQLKEAIARLAQRPQPERQLVGDLVQPGDLVVLVTPIDSAAPKGRLILPQQQTIRDLLDHGAVSLVVQQTQLKTALASLAAPPRMIITDSQAFGPVSQETPEGVLLTSFSILFARYKGELEEMVRGAACLSRLKPGDTVLISEGCTHHRQCGDIGTVKLPAWIRQLAGVELNFEFTSGGDFPDDLSRYALIVHCGGCMLNEREMKSRIRRAQEAGVPITNYGTAIAQAHGILRRALSPFPALQSLVDGAD